MRSGWRSNGGCWMGEVPESIAEIHRRENQDLIVSAVAYVAIVFAISLVTGPLPSNPLSMVLYVALVLALVGRYPAWSRRTWHDSREPVLAPYDLFMLFVGAGLCFGVALLLRGRAAPYFYLSALEGSIVLILLKRRPLIGVWFLFLAGLSLFAHLLREGWSAAGTALLRDLPGYLLVVAVAELMLRQMVYRDRAEALLDELGKAHRRLQDYTAQAETLAVANERTRLAREIHDTLGHTLTALDVQMELLARLPQSETVQRRQAADHARGLLKEGLADVRRAVQALRPSALEALSLPEALRDLAADFERDTRVPTAVETAGAMGALPADMAVPLYRAAQEALTNVRRHAPGSPGVRLRLHYSPKAVTLSVENDKADGRSPLLAAEEAGGGQGLRGLRERAKALGGTLRFGPDDGGAFRVEMILPIPPSP